MVDSIRSSPLAPPKPQVDEAEAKAEVKTGDAPTAEKPLDLTYRGSGWRPAPAAVAEAQAADKPSLLASAAGAALFGLAGGAAYDYAKNKPQNPGRRVIDNMKGTFQPWDADFSNYGMGKDAAHNAIHFVPGAIAYLGGRARGHSKLESAGLSLVTGVFIEVGQSRKDAGDAIRTMVGGTAGGMVAEELIGLAIKDSNTFGGDGNPVQRLLKGITSVMVGPNKSFHVTASYDF